MTTDRCGLPGDRRCSRRVPRAGRSATQRGVTTERAHHAGRSPCVRARGGDDSGNYRRYVTSCVCDASLPEECDGRIATACRQRERQRLIVPPREQRTLALDVEAAEAGAFQVVEDGEEVGLLEVEPAHQRADRRRRVAALLKEAEDANPGWRKRAANVPRRFARRRWCRTHDPMRTFNTAGGASCGRVRRE